LIAPPSSSPQIKKPVSPPKFQDCPDICPRNETVQKLVDLIDDNTVLHVRGTPSSGKSVLAGLLYWSFREKNRKVLFIHLWDRGNSESARNFLARKCRESGYEDHDIISESSVFIIDEAQQSYTHHDFWYDIIKTQSGQSSGPKFCLFSSFGSPVTGVPKLPRTITPPVLSNHQRVSLVKSHHPWSPDVGLFYNWDEFEDAVERYYRYSSARLKLDPGARDYLFSLTNGHPGAVRSLLGYLEMVCLTLFSSNFH
jgi:hypothetical protein